MKNIDESKVSFETFKKEIEKYKKEDITESDTRSKLIDVLLISVLGWDESDIRREGYNDSGYYDYKVSVPGIHFLVEAKKQFKELSLPTNHKRVTVKSLLSENAEVINQIRDYANDEGIPYGVITNGTQFVLLKVSNTDGTPWKSNHCLIFNGIQEIENRYIEFYDNLSKHSIVSNGGFKFDLPISNVEYKTVLSTLVAKDKELIRNDLSASITPLIDNIFGEIFSEEQEDDKEFIKKCFVENKETKKNKSEIERLFGDYAPKLANVVRAVNSDSVVQQIEEEIKEDEVAAKNHHPPKPIIIIGSKGSGKTTFINHLFKYRLGEDELENHFIVYIDFRKFFEGESHFEHSRIAEEILEKVYTKYESLELHSLTALKRIYYKEIKRNDDSVWSFDRNNDLNAYNKRLSSFLEDSKKDPLHHLELLSKYLIRERRKRLIVIIDNADQFNDSIQEKLFVFAHSLTKTSLCGTVVSLREGYYYKWQNSPPFDAYESNIYHITAPNYAEVLQKRIDFALEKGEKLVKKVSGIDENGFKIEYSSSYIIDFLSGLKNSLFSEQNTRIIDYLNHTTYPNIREGLKVFKTFLISGHTKVSDYILREKYRNEQKKEHQVIPFHEFFKSIALQNKHYYNSEISIVSNLFIPPVDSTDHFIKIYILKDLHESIEKHNYTDRFVTSESIISKLSMVGFRSNTINSAILSLMKASLIDTDEQLTDIDWKELPSRFNMCLTSKGHYYLLELLNKFSYIDLVLQDTPIFDHTFFETIKSEFPEATEKGVRKIEQRKNVVKLFMEYLKSYEEKQSNQAKVVYGNITIEMLREVEMEMNRFGY